MAAHVTFMDSEIKMLFTAQNCPTPGRQLCPWKPISSHLKLTCPCVLLPDFCLGLSGLECRHPVPSRKRRILSLSVQQNWESSIKWNLSYKFYGFYSFTERKTMCFTAQWLEHSSCQYKAWVRLLFFPFSDKAPREDLLAATQAS